jgi:hypothetical protein
MISTPSDILPLISSYILGNKTELQNAKSGEFGSCYTCGILCLAQAGMNMLVLFVVGLPIR